MKEPNKGRSIRYRSIEDLEDGNGVDEADMASMELTPSEKAEFEEEVKEPEAPEFPFGLTLMLDEKVLDKLGIGELPEVGQELSIIARAEVKSVSSRDTAVGGPGDGRSVELQITDMAVEEE